MRDATALPAIHILRRDRSGSSSPVVVETAQGEFVVKLRGSAQGTAALVAEVIVGALADRLGLRVPERRIITTDGNTPTADRNDELADLLRMSWGENLGFRLLPRARAFTAGDLATVDRDFAAQVRWLDWLVLNTDRTAANPNILVSDGRLWLIDHGAALPFQHDWTAVTEQPPARPEPRVSHVFDGVADRFEDWDPLLSALLTREELVEAVAAVPVSFLMPLLPAVATPEALERRRAAYVAFLWKRLHAKRSFPRSCA